MVKPRLQQPQAADRGSAQQVLMFALDQLCRLLHPITPFVTEALWAELNKAAPRRGLRDIAQAEPALIAARWPSADATLQDDQAESGMAVLQDTIWAIRDIKAGVNRERSLQGRNPLAALPLGVLRAAGDELSILAEKKGLIASLGGCDSLDIGPDATKPVGSLGRVVNRVQVFVPVGTLVDLSQLHEHEQAEVQKLRDAKSRVDKQLANERFVQNADPAVVEQARGRAGELEEKIRLLEQHLDEMQG